MQNGKYEESSRKKQFFEDGHLELIDAIEKLKALLFDLEKSIRHHCGNPYNGSSKVTLVC